MVVGGDLISVLMCKEKKRGRGRMNLGGIKNIKVSLALDGDGGFRKPIFYMLVK